MKYRQPCQRLLVISLLAICGAAISTAARAEDTATLKGRFIYDGTPPVPVKIIANKDPQFCGKFNLVNEDLLVDKNGGVANVVVWLYTPGVKPANDQVPKNPAVLDNKGCHFDPHVLVMRAGQPLLIKNSDIVGHNTMATPMSNPQFNETIPAGNTVTKDNFTKPERLPFRVSCGIHTWMGGWIVLKDTPYVAVSAPDGTFSIPNLPVGQKLEFQAWQESGGYVKPDSVGGKPEKWLFGRFKITLNAGVNDLGDIKFK